MNASQLGTWERGKDALLVGFVGITAVLAMKILTDLAELKRDLAVFQANVTSLKESHDRLEKTVMDHLNQERWDRDHKGRP